MNPQLTIEQATRTEPMHDWEIQIIQQAFNKCYGLYGAIMNDTRGSVDELARQTGMRTKFIKDNLELIKTL